jgi:hypothetical protein
VRVRKRAIIGNRMHTGRGRQGLCLAFQTFVLKCFLVGVGCIGRIGRFGLKHPLRRRLEEDGTGGHGKVGTLSGVL